MSFISDYFARRSLHRVFRRLTRDLTSEPFNTTLTEAPVRYAFVLVSQDSADAAARSIEQVVLVAGEAGAQIQLLSPLVLISTGVFPKSSLSSEQWHELLNGLQARLGTRAKVVHGATLGSHGVMGSTNFAIHFGVLLPQFHQALSVLLHTPFGGCEDLDAHNG